MIDSLNKWVETRSGRYIELLVLFIIVPISLAFDLPRSLKALVVCVGMIYVVHVAVKGKLFTKRNLLGKMALRDERGVWLKVAFYIPVSTAIGWYVLRDDLFNMVQHRPLFWLGFCVLYSIFSVYVQEFLYRTFFFFRYADFLPDKGILFINAIVFGLAHSMFGNIYIVLLTTIGGFMLARTFQKTRSLFITSIEHAIYGCWLFTLGVGKDLAFPEPREVFYKNVEAQFHEHIDRKVGIAEYSD